MPLRYAMELININTSILCNITHLVVKEMMEEISEVQIITEHEKPYRFYSEISANPNRLPLLYEGTAIPAKIQLRHDCSQSTMSLAESF